MITGIDRFVGRWRNAEGFRLEIRQTDATRATASLFSPFGAPVIPPYYDNRTTVEMPAIYHDYDGDMEISLWRDGSGFVLQLEHEKAYDLDETRREALIPALSQYAEDTFLDQYHALFGKLSHYTRDKAEPSHATDG